MKSKRIYICHPYSDSPWVNRDLVKGIAHDILDRYWGDDGPEVIPEAPQVWLDRVLDPDRGEFADRGDDDERERTWQRAMAVCLELLSRCDELWICSTELSRGMLVEIQYAQEHQIPIKTDWLALTAAKQDGESDG